MKYFLFILCISQCLLSSSCTNQKAPIQISFSVVKSKVPGDKLLKVKFINLSDDNQMVVPIVVWKKMFGLDQCIHLNLYDEFPIKIRDLQINCFSDSDSTPIKYIYSNPKIEKNIELHLNAKKSMIQSKTWEEWEDIFTYLNDSSRVPSFIFIKSNSESTLTFKIKNNLRGKYLFSILSKQEINKLSGLKRGMDMKEKYFKSRPVDGYIYSDYFQVNPIEVEF
jgi:hypothetical protein